MGVIWRAGLPKKLYLLLLYSPKKGPMGRAPYKSTKEGGVGALSIFRQVTMQVCPRHTYSNSPSKQVIAHKITASKLSPDGKQHFSPYLWTDRQTRVAA